MSIDRRQIIKVITLAIAAIGASSALLHAAVLLHEQQAHFRPSGRLRSRKRKRDEDAEEDVLFLMAITAAACRPYPRRFGMDICSSHWITRVLEGMLLRDDEFDKCFRQSRNSFHALHMFLGIVLHQIQLA